MGTFKKISCLIFCAFIIFPFSVFADDETTAAVEENVPYSLEFSPTYYMWSYHHYPNGVSSNNNATDLWASHVYSTFPSSDYYEVSLGRPRNSANTGYIDFAELGFSVIPLDSSNQVPLTWNPDYTYEAKFSFRATMPMSNGSPVFSMPLNKALTLADNYDRQVWNDSILFNDEDEAGEYYHCDYDLESLISTNGSSYVTFACNYTYTFNLGLAGYTAEDLAGLSYLICSVSISAYDDYVNLPDASYLMLKFNAVDISGIYDPTGSYVPDEDDDNGVGDIVQGQQDAVQYGLDYEEQANQDAYDSALEDVEADASGLDITSSFSSSLTNLYNSITYTGQSFSFKLPASGNIPYLNTSLWDEQDIPIKDYIDKVPSVVWIIINFILWFLVVRRIIKLVHRLLDYIGGGSSGGGD